MAVLGLGLGATMQNLVLAVQNNAAQSDMGAASSVVAFFRSMGGSIGVSALGAVLSDQVADRSPRAWPRWASPPRRPGEPLDPRPRRAAGSGPGGLRARLRRGDRPPLPGRRTVRRPGPRLRAVHPRGAAAHHHPARGRARAGGDRGAEPAVNADDTQPDAPRGLEQEVGVVIRRVKRVIGERARAVHQDLQPGSYLVLATSSRPARAGPRRSPSAFDIDKGAISRQVQHLTELGLIERTPDPADGRATLLAVTDDARRRMADVTGTGASTSTSGSATGPTRTSAPSSTCSAATTPRSS